MVGDHCQVLLSHHSYDLIDYPLARLLSSCENCLFSMGKILIFCKYGFFKRDTQIITTVKIQKNRTSEIMGKITTPESDVNKWVFIILLP